MSSLARTASRCRRDHILPLWLFLSFFYFRRLISEVTERISTKLGHIFTYDCYLKNLARTSWGIYPTRWEGKAGKHRFLGLTLNFDQTYRTWFQQSEKNSSIYNDCPTCRQIWWTLVHKRLRMVAEFLTTPKFLHWETLPALPHGRYITDSIGKLWHVLCSGTSLVYNNRMPDGLTLGFATLSGWRWNDPFLLRTPQQRLPSPNAFHWAENPQNCLFSRGGTRLHLIHGFYLPSAYRSI